MAQTGAISRSGLPFWQARCVALPGPWPGRIALDVLPVGCHTIYEIAPDWRIGYDEVVTQNEKTWFQA
jgi:hypothetical protein